MLSPLLLVGFFLYLQNRLSMVVEKETRVLYKVMGTRGVDEGD